MAEAEISEYIYLSQAKDKAWSVIVLKCFQLSHEKSEKCICNLKKYSRLSLSRTRLSRITAYLEVIIWSLF